MEIGHAAELKRGPGPDKSDNLEDKAESRGRFEAVSGLSLRRALLTALPAVSQRARQDNVRHEETACRPYHHHHILCHRPTSHRLTTRRGARARDRELAPCSSFRVHCSTLSSLQHPRKIRPGASTPRARLLRRRQRTFLTAHHPANTLINPLLLTTLNITLGLDT